MTPLFRKLNLGTHQSILVLNAPGSFDAELAQLAGIEIIRSAPSASAVQFAIGFAITQKELNRLSAQFAKMTSVDAIVWVAYPKGTSKKYRCEFNRDTGWEVLGSAGFEPVRQVAVDEDWSSLRFRRTEHRIAGMVIRRRTLRTGRTTNGVGCQWQHFLGGPDSDVLDAGWNESIQALFTRMLSSC